MFKMRFWPMTARPINAMSPLASMFIPVRWLLAKSETGTIQKWGECARRIFGPRWPGALDKILHQPLPLGRNDLSQPARRRNSGTQEKKIDSFAEFLLQNRT